MNTIGDIDAEGDMVERSMSEISAELYVRAEDDAVPLDISRLMRNAALEIDVHKIRLKRVAAELRAANSELRAVRPCVEVYRDKYDFTKGTAMLEHLDGVLDPAP